MKSEPFVEPDIHGGGEISHKTAKNVGMNIASQSKDNHKLENLFWLKPGA